MPQLLSVWNFEPPLLASSIVHEVDEQGEQRIRIVGAQVHLLEPEQLQQACSRRDTDPVPISQADLVFQFRHVDTHSVPSVNHRPGHRARWEPKVKFGDKSKQLSFLDCLMESEAS